MSAQDNLLKKIMEAVREYNRACMSERIKAGKRMTKLRKNDKN